MNFLELTFAAWGPFTDRRLDFSIMPGGLHVVFGPNEAGKSSALRGLRALLFGIDATTHDNFVHPYPNLRIAARLKAADDTELHVVRRKGTKNTLLAADGKTPLGDDALRSFLGAITEDLFCSHFAMGHEDLVRGGEEILAGKGDVGRSLFSTAVGGTRLRQIIEGLEQEMSELYGERAKNAHVNRALRELVEQQKRLVEAALGADSWRRQDDEVRSIEGERDALGRRIRDARESEARLARLKALLPKVEEWRAQKRLEEDLGPLVLLPPEFGEERRRSIEALERAESDLLKADLELADLQTTLAAVSAEEGLLDGGARVDELFKDLGANRKAAKDRASIEQRQRAAEHAALALLHDLRSGLDLEYVKTVRPSLVTRTRVNSLRTEIAGNTAAQSASAKNLAEFDTSLARTRAEFTALPPTRDSLALDATLAAAASLGEAGHVSSLAKELERLVAQASRDIERLGLWSGTIDQAERLPLPNPDNLNKLEHQFEVIEWDAAELTADQRRHREAVEHAERQLAAIVGGGDVPSEQALLDSRTRRDRLWEVVRRSWIGWEESVDPPMSELPFAYESSVRSSDTVADQLRREAERVSTRIQVEEQLRELRLAADKHAQTLSQIADRRLAWDTAWKELWAPTGVVARDITEMRAFFTAMNGIRELAERVRAMRQTLVERQDNIAAHQLALRAALQDSGAELGPDDLPLLINYARMVAQTIDDNARRRAEMTLQIHEMEARSGIAREEHGAIIAKGEALLGALRELAVGLPVDDNATVDEVAAAIDILHQAAQKLEEAEGEKARIRGIDRDAGRFDEAVREFCARVAPDTLHLSAGDIVEELHKRRGTSRENAAVRAEVEKRRAETVERRAAAARRIQLARASIAALCDQASVEALEDLHAAELKSTTAHRIRDRIAELERDLATMGATITDALAAVEGFDHARLDGDLGEVRRLLREEAPKESELSEKLGEARRTLQQMSGDAAAVHLAESVQTTLAQLRTNAERYMELQVASRLLRWEIERYRKAHQGPLLARAGELFARLTRGAFSRLDAELNDDDEPTIVGIRSNGASVYVEGMSSGTRDQLHLALRLAHIDEQLNVGEPLPLVLDDLLVHFDDDRSAAALEVLLEMSQRTQILLFTHHTRVRELALEHGGSRVQVHPLGGV